MSAEQLTKLGAPYECRLCPKCQAINWAIGLNPYEIQYETEVIRCWKCKTAFWLESYDNEIYKEDDDNALICEGTPDPSIPLEVLQTLVDVAQLGMKEFLNTDASDDELMELFNDIQGSINYVKTLISEGIIDLKTIS